MAILRITEKCEEWSGNRTDKGEYEFSRVFIVQVDTRQVGPYEILNGSVADGVDSPIIQIPLDNDDYHAGDDALTHARVKTKDAKRDPVNPLLWYVTVTYSTAKDQQERGTFNPEDRPIEVNFSFQRQTKVAHQEANGDPITTSAGERFNPLPEMDDTRFVMTMSRNLVTFNPDTAMRYKDTVNSDQFQGFEPGVVKLASLNSKLIFENNLTYWRVDFEFHINEDGWDIELLDEGTYYLSGANKRRFRDEQGHFITGLLDGAGGQGDPNDPQFLQKRVYRRRSFNALGLPVVFS